MKEHLWDEQRSREQYRAEYARWAKTYDEELLKEWEYKLPAVVCELFKKYVKKRDAMVLDAGVGTGITGEVLEKQGYSKLYGLDLSPEMLEQAGRKKIYQGLEEMVLGEELRFPDNHFDAVLSVGTIGLAPKESFDELIRVTRPGGVIVFSIRVIRYEQGGFKEKQRSLENDGKWKLLEKTPAFVGLPGYAPDVLHYGFAYRIL